MPEQMNIDEDYTKPVLDLMRKALKGNGVRSDNVSIKNFDGTVLEFKAATHINFHNKTSEKTLPGKATGGKIFQDRQTAYKEAQNYLSAALQDPAQIEQIKTLIKQKPHHGFGIDNQTIKLSFLDQEFVSHDPCNPCHGKGLTKCAKCRGKGYVPCTNCNAQGFEKCNECNGNRQVRGPNGQMQTCNLCQGLGKTSCSFCRENRQVQCSICKTKGETRCKSCGGQGAQSNIISAEITAQCSYDFDAEPLPERAVVEVKKLGVNLADQATITPIAQEDLDGEQEVLHLFYEVSVPQGNVEFSIKDQTVKAYLFGTEEPIVEIPDFLDSIIAPGIKKLSQAANGQGGINENIRAAVKYKTIRQAVTLAARYNPKKAMKALLHYTPLGLSVQTTQKLIEDANAALNNATKQRRMLAMIFGAGGAIILGALYFLSPARSTVLEQITNANLHIAVDVVVLGVCAGIAYSVWKTISSHARKQILKTLIAPK